MANESVSSKTDGNSNTSGAKGSVRSRSSFSILPLPGGRSHTDVKCCWAIALFLRLLNQYTSKTSFCSKQGGRQLGSEQGQCPWSRNAPSCE